jgi:hypothetical protein
MGVISVKKFIIYQFFIFKFIMASIKTPALTFDDYKKLVEQLENKFQATHSALERPTMSVNGISELQPSRSQNSYDVSLNSGELLYQKVMLIKQLRELEEKEKQLQVKKEKKSKTINFRKL